MKWTVDFYNERRGIVARYHVHAPSAARAGRLSLFERAQRIRGQDETGWIVYRIAKGEAMPAHAGAS